MPQLILSYNQKILALVLSLSLLSFFSYFYFISQPKLVDIKGAKTTYSATVPVPQTKVSFFTPVPSKTIEIGFDVSTKSRSRVLESAKNIEELSNFYKNYFAMQNWVLVDESFQIANNGFYSLEFMQGTKLVKITMSEQGGLAGGESAQENVPVLINVQEHY